MLPNSADIHFGKICSSKSCSFFILHYFPAHNHKLRPQSNLSDLSCGGTLRVNSGELTSPGYPSDYPPDVDCRWIIRVDEEATIRLQFHHFEVRLQCLGTVYWVMVFRLWNG